MVSQSPAGKQTKAPIGNLALLAQAGLRLIWELSMELLLDFPGFIDIFVGSSVFARSMVFSPLFSDL